MKQNQLAIVTGANRGLGFETTRQLARQGIHVLLTSRSIAKGREALDKLTREGLEASFHELDVRSAESIDELARHVEHEYGRLDILVNNAGVFLDDRDSESASVFSARIDTIRETMETNVYGPLLLCQKLIPLMKKNGHGRVVNLSSGMGQLSEMNGGNAGYRLSKTAINAVTRIFADELQGTDILVNSVCPGWVKTDMGGEGAELEVEEGVQTIVWLATLPKGGPTGGFFREKERIDW